MTDQGNDGGEHCPAGTDPRLVGGDAHHLEGTLRPASFDMPPAPPSATPPISAMGQAGPAAGTGGFTTPNPTSQLEDTKRHRWLVPVGAVGALVAGLLSFGVARAVVDRPSAAKAIELVAADEVGSSPFVSVGTDLSDEEIEVAREAGTNVPLMPPPSTDGGGLVVTAVAVGPTAGAVYASRTKPVCDVASIARALQADSKVRTSWANLVGVSASEAEVAVRDLTLLVLTRDTAVTNSRYPDGTPETFQAVLQAGTPVLVDGFGVPRVRCAGGNPLSAPRRLDGKVRITGDRWLGFDPTAVVSVSRSAGPVTGVHTIDLNSALPTRVEFADATPVVPPVSSPTPPVSATTVPPSISVATTGTPTTTPRVEMTLASLEGILERLIEADGFGPGQVECSAVPPTGVETQGCGWASVDGSQLLVAVLIGGNGSVSYSFPGGM